MSVYECYRLHSQGVDQLAPSSAIPLALPSSVVCAAGVYASSAYGGVAWDMKLSGLYAIIRWPDSSIPDSVSYANYRIVKGSPFEILSAVCNLCTHGRADEDLFTPATINWTGILAELGTRGMALLCGNSSALAARILATAGYKDGIDFRTVRIVTSGPPNNIDDGHVGLELRLAGKWVFVDVTFDRVFTIASIMLSLDEVIQASAPTPLLIAKPSYTHRQYVDGKTTDFPSHAYHLVLDEPAWRVRAWHIPAIVSAGITYCWIPPARDSQRARDYVTSLGWKILDRLSWEAFYQ